MTEVKTCPTCGKKFMTEFSFKKFCSSNCQRRSNNQILNKSHKKPESRPKKSSKPKAKVTAELAHKLRMQRQLEAQKLGITYGQYIARFNLQEL